MKRSLLFLTLISAALAANSQSSFGVKAGINESYQTLISTSTFFPSRTTHTGSLFNYQLGFFYKLSLNKKLTISTEANFSLIGGKNLYLSLPHPGDTAFIEKFYNDRIGYVEVPLMLQYNFKKFYFGGGPSVAYKI